MSYIKADSPREQQYFDFLEELRQSGETNMFGAGPYLATAFPSIQLRAFEIVGKWMKLHSDKKRILLGPSTDSKVIVKMGTRMYVTRKQRAEGGE